MLDVTNECKRETFDVVGVARIPYIGKGVDGHNCDFNYYPMLMIAWQVLMTSTYGQRYVLNTWEEHGECSSGWCTARWGHYSIYRLDTNESLSLTHTTKRSLSIRVKSGDDIKSELLDINTYGSDAYYPNGHVTVDEDLLEPTGRGHNHPLTYVLRGDSNLTKSTLGHKINMFNEYGVYETDTSPELPDQLPHGVIVMGNKYTHDLDSVRESIKGVGIPTTIIDISMGLGN